MGSQKLGSVGVCLTNTAGAVYPPSSQEEKPAGEVAAEPTTFARRAGTCPIFYTLDGGTANHCAGWAGRTQCPNTFSNRWHVEYVGGIPRPLNLRLPKKTAGKEFIGEARPPTQRYFELTSTAGWFDAEIRSGLRRSPLAWPWLPTLALRMLDSFQTVTDRDRADPTVFPKDFLRSSITLALGRHQGVTATGMSVRTGSGS